MEHGLLRYFVVKLKDKVEHGLNESRMLIMGVQVLLAFDFQVFLMRRFEKMPRLAHDLQLAATALLLIATLLLLAPAAHHQLVEKGNDSHALVTFTRRVTAAALLPFGLAFGVEFFVVICRVLGPSAGAIGGLAAAIVTLAAWYVVPWAAHRKQKVEDTMDAPSLNEKIKQAMIEIRVVLPGTQALLGFQLTGVLQDGFDELPHSSRLMFVGGLVFLGASVISLMLPSAFHRIAEEGEISERLHRFSARSLLVAMFTLALGLACDVFVVVSKSLSAPIGVAAALAWLVTSLGVWFGWSAIAHAPKETLET